MTRTNETMISPAEAAPEQARMSRLEFKLYYWLCFPVLLLFVFMTGFMIYEVTRVFINEAHDDSILVLKNGVEQLRDEINEYENFTTRWIEDFRAHQGYVGHHDDNLDAQSVVYDHEGLEFLILSRQGQLVLYRRYVQNASIIMVTEKLAQESQLAREISRRLSVGSLETGWTISFFLPDRGWQLSYFEKLSDDQTLIMLVPLQKLNRHLNLHYFSTEITTFLALTDQHEQTLAGSGPDTRNYLRFVDSGDITHTELPHWTEYITGIRNFILYYPEPLLPGLYLGISYDDINLYDRLRHYLLLGLILSFIGMGLLYLVVRNGIKFFSRSITDLRDQLEIVSSGNLDMQLPENQRYREITYITKMVNQLLRQLKNHVDELQQETERSASLASEIAIAGRIQQDLLVYDVGKIAGQYNIDLAVLLAPAKEIAGDFYCLAPRPHGKLLFAVGDVSGKGIAAALVAKDCVNLIDTYGQDLTPAQLLQQMNADLFDRFSRQSMFVTLFCCLLDTENGVLEHCDAGHETPLLYRAGTEGISRLDVERNMALGFLPDTTYKATSMKLEKNHTLLLYTDGLDGDLHKQDGTPGLPLGVTLLSNRMLTNVDLQTKIHCINNLALRKQGGEPYDDITLLGVSLEKSAYQSFLIPPEPGEVGNAISRLRAQLEESHAGTEAGNRLSVVLDEWVSNLARYAGVDSDIIISSRCDPEGVDLEIIASCNSSINPLQRPELDVYNHLQSNAVGGFGIHIIRNLVDDVSYDTDANWVKLKVRVNKEK